MKPSLYFRALIGETIPIPDMTGKQLFDIENGIRNVLEAIEADTGKPSCVEVQVRAHMNSAPLERIFQAILSLKETT